MKKGDMFLVGVDTKKDPEIIHNAYHDGKLFSNFFMNSLARINRELEGTFNLDKFFSYCYYDPKIG